MLLAKEHNFALSHKTLNGADNLLPFEIVYRNIKTMDVTSSDLGSIKVALEEYAYSSFKECNFLKELNLSRDEYNALKNLLSLESIIIQKLDEGNSVVLMNRDDYLNQIETLISDAAKFQKLSVPENKDYNFMVKEKRLVDNILDTLYEKNAITRDIKTLLTPDGPSPARLYGLPKIHKALVDGLPNYRPIISQIGSPTYKIAKYLLDFISPITKNEYTLKDSFEFVSMIDKQDHNSFMCSFDIDSLFTNVPLEETIEIVIKNVFGRKRKINGLSKSDFRDLLKLTTMSTVFYFNGNYYKQLDGVAMGSPLGPALANAFLCHHESKWLRECPVAYAPIFYKHYVDDIFVLLKSENHVNNLLFYLNSKHPNIRFTCEIEKDRSLAFLDINFIGVIINPKHQYTVNQHFLEFIPIIDPLLQLSIKVV